MLQKGVMSDVSLHRESGHVLDVEDTLDFGDCYAGLVAVSTLFTHTIAEKDIKLSFDLKRCHSVGITLLRNTAFHHRCELFG